MSDAVVGIIAVAVVAVAGHGLTFWMWRKTTNDRREERAEDHREWYQRTLFEKRMAAVQEAYDWLAQLRSAFARARGSEIGEQDSSELAPPRRELIDLAEHARAWWDSNNLVLEDELPPVSSFVGLTNTALQFAVARFGWDEADKACFQVDEELRERAKSLMALEAERPA